ncbi:hypothetical protein HOT49_gp018 [Erwinia phage vB_EamM_Alexandra]|uniref:DUF1611 domain-containing protein n=1 Tax=Erwinia phage vB_EamM_Alexandra TaxID=2201424 RepID=A0A2Z4QE41_9CAUD|nr:hypothetical protein HOT49_gp018 [Erwinia phage vB_EamM_Alexandra]AWY08299.1 hypothetical protein Alexandra_18 [Erwinia phage vB_EamM_Alexandra]
MNVSGDIYNIPQPFAMYCGNCETRAQAKVAAGTIEWARDKVCCVVADDNGLFPDMPHVNVASIHATDAETLVIGCAPFGGKIDEQMDSAIRSAIYRGRNIAAAMHTRLADNPEYVELADRYNVKLYDFRHRPDAYPLGTGEKRNGIRLLTVGTDSSCGKKFTTLTLHRALKERHDDTVFCSTGQTGFLISDCGINNDTLVADFLAGAAESLSPEGPVDRVYLIEGQGAITHPAYTGGSMSLIAGSQPDYFIMCHAWERKTQLGVNRVPNLVFELKANMDAAAIHGLTPKYLGISINFSECDATLEQQDQIMRDLEIEFGMPVFDPLRNVMVVEELANALHAEAMRRSAENG